MLSLGRALLLICILFPGCVTRPGTPLKRTGDEIIVAGQMFHTGTPVVLWMDPGGYDAYRVERRFAPLERSDWANYRDERNAPSSPNRYGLRRRGLSQQDIQRVRGGGWDLPTLQKVVDQFVLHFDVAGISRNCFKVLQDDRGLSVHFMLDLDGTIYQTLDAKERAWHATISNDRSVGVEIANMGGYTNVENSPLAEWYHIQPDGRALIAIPARFGADAERAPNFVGRPARRNPVAGRVQGQELRQYDFTPQQYRALARLTATICTVLPRINCDYPRDAAGKLVPHKLPDARLKDYHGVLGHYHIQTNKTDPGPALQWDYVIGEARRLMKLPPLRQDAEGKPAPPWPELVQDE
jgi:N-acetyl-anhydromuramyl-L-alanine amidase AmpD